MSLTAQQQKNSRCFLRQYYDYETSKNIYPEKASDLVAWKLILRLLSFK